MSEEKETTAEDTEPTQETADLDAQITAARALLETQGLYVLDEHSFGKVKAKASRPIASELEETKARLAALEDERNALAAFKAEQENEGKSKAELLEQQIKAAHDEIKARDAEVERIRAERDEMINRAKAKALDSELSKLLPKATEPEAALLWAKAKIPGLHVSDTGDLVITKASGLDIEGDAARAYIAEWWKDQSFLRSSREPGPPTAGARTPPPPKENRFDPRRFSDFDEMMRAAKEAKRQRGEN